MKPKYVYLSIILFILTTTLIGLSLFRSSFAANTTTQLPSSNFHSNKSADNKVNILSDSLKSQSTYTNLLDNFNVQANYSTSNNLPLYSLMKNLEFPTTNETFELLSDDANPVEITDKGLIYIMSHGYNLTNQTNNVFSTNNHGTVTDNKIKQYITQIAMWLYIFENKGSFSKYCVETNINNNVTSCDFYDKSNNSLMTSQSIRSMITQAANNNSYKYLNYIITLVDEAKSYTKQNSAMTSISTDSISYTFNDDHLVSSIINPSASTNISNYLNYSVEISDSNNYGVYLVNTQDEKITDTSSLTGGFKVYIPLKKDITTMNLASIKITIKGAFMQDKGYEYRVTKSTGDLLDNKKQKYANQMIAHVPLITANTSFNLRNYVKISKVDVANSEELAGAKLVIKNKDSKSEVDSWTSTTTPHYTFLDEGNYELCETTAPDGYELKTECINFQVTNDKIVSETMENKAVEIPNTSATTNILAYIIGSLLFATGAGIIFYSLKVNKISE